MAELKALEHSLTQGKISRREFLTRLSALGITTALSPTFFCTPAQAKKPQKGGRLRLGLGGGSTTDSLDPATMTDAMAYNINWQVRNCLTEVDYRGNIVPELAKSWESSSDAKTGHSNFVRDCNSTMARPWRQTISCFPSTITAAKIQNQLQKVLGIPSKT